MWKCRICGYISEDNEPPEKCRICGALKEKFYEAPKTGFKPSKPSNANETVGQPSK